MTRRDESALLWDIVEHGGAALSFVSEQTLEQYVEDVLLQSAVERQIAIVGEAYGLLERIRPDFSERLPGEAYAAVGMRNILIHGYESVDVAEIYSVVRNDLPPLVAAAERLLLELTGGIPAP